MTERAQALEAALERMTLKKVQQYRIDGYPELADAVFGFWHDTVREVLRGQPPPPVGSPTTEHEHDYVAVELCRHCLRTEADITGECHHCDEGTGARCWWCFKLKSTPVAPAGASESPSEMDSGIVLLVSAASAASGYLERQQPDLAAWLWNAVQLVLNSQSAPVSPVEPAGASEPPSDYIDIVFDGPPASESGRFIEVENAQGASIRVGEWVHRPDGYWALRLPAPVSPVEPTPNDTLLRNIRMAAAMGLSFGHQATPQPMERMVERKDKRLRQILTLLAEHGVTGSMLRAESNAPVGPTPEPPQGGEDRTHLHRWHLCPNCGGRGCNSAERGGNDRCWHCGICDFVECVDSNDGVHQPSVEPAPPSPAPCVWRDIASAPKDETPIRLKWAGTTVEAIGRWCPAQVLPSGFGRSNYSDDWRDVEGDDVLLLPTHWKPVIVSGSPLKVER